MTEVTENNQTSLDELLAAKQLSSEKEIVDVEERQIKLVIFTLDNKFFALPGHSVKEILSNDIQVSFVPGMPESVEGIINLRGDIESVLCLNPLLQLPQLEPEHFNQSSILLCTGAGISTGIRIDRLREVTDVAESLLKPVPDSLPEHMQPYVSALLTYNDWSIAVLDIDHLLQAWQTRKQ